MDDKLKELLENERYAKFKQALYYTDIEYDMNLNIVEAAKVAIENYIKYKKSEEKYNKSVELQKKYYNTINNTNI